MDKLRRTIVVVAIAITAACRIDTAQEPAAPTAQKAAGTVVQAVATTSTATNPLIGEAPIADNFDTDAALRPADEVPPTPVDPVGAFRFTCLAGHLAKDDPLVYPGQPGVSHLHQFFGNTGTNASSNYQSLRTTGGTTCGDPATPVQRTAYWTPAMLDGVGNAIKPDFMLTYYKAIPNTSRSCGAPDATHLGYCTDLPNGLRFIFGYNMSTGKGGPTDTNSPDYWAFAFECVDASFQPYTGRYHTIAEVVNDGRCPVGAWLRVAASIPDCWNGKDLDSADHRSHMSYGTGALVEGKLACPATHPYRIPEMSGQWLFTVDANFLAGKWHLSSDEMVPGVAAGTTMHMDYWEAWSPAVKARWEANCINRHLNCNNGNLGDGMQIKGIGVPDGGWPKHQLVSLSSLGTATPTPTPTPSPSPTPTPIDTPTTKTCPDGTIVLSTETCPSVRPGKGVGRKK